MAKRLPAGIIVGVVIAAGIAGLNRSAPAVEAATSAVADQPTFGEPTIAGLQGNGFEENVRVAPDRTIYTSAPGALSSDTSWVWRSLDGGQTFKWVPAAVPLTGKFGTCPGGGDTELAVDAAGHLYFNDLTLLNFSTARSDDKGKTIAAQSCTAVETTPNDRQWYASDGDPTQPPGPGNVGNLYLAYNVVAGGSPFNCPNGAVITANNVLTIARSPVAGAQALAGVQFAPSKFVTGPCQEGIMGNVEVSPTTHHIFVAHPDAFRTSIRIARCEAVPFTLDPAGLSCVDKPVAGLPQSAPAGCIGTACQGTKTGANFPSLAIDKAGNLFAVWQQAPVNNCGPGCFSAGDVSGDTLLFWSSSADEGNTWSTPVQIPTPGLHQNVFTWAAAGDAGRVDIAWYGSDAPTQGDRGPDSSPGFYSVYFTQTLNGTDPAPTFTAPVQASGHHIHRSTMFTLIGRQTGNRALGDFLQVRIGQQGEAIIAYGDTTNRNRLAHAMVVRQIGGTGVFAANPIVVGSPPPFGSATDAAADARFEANGNVSASQPNLDIVSSSVAKINATTYRVTMKVADLASLAPDPTTGNTDTTLVWNTMWFVPSATDSFGGKNFFVYMESTNGGPPKFFAGENARQRIGGGVAFTYPGVNEITGSIINGAKGEPDTIVTDVPIAHVTLAGAIDDLLHNVTASTMTLPGPAELPPFDPTTGLGGTLFNLIDVAPAYDARPRFADLSVTKTDSPDPVIAGANLSYAVTVRNSGPDAAPDVTLVDTLPASVNLVSTTPGGPTCTASGGTIRCALGTLASGASVPVTIVVRPQIPGTITNSVTVSGAVTDPNAANDTAAAATKVNPGADLAITKTDSPDPVIAGETLTYPITVTNNGPQPATGVTVTDKLPKNASGHVLSGGCTLKPDKTTVVCSLGNMATGATATVTISIKITAASKTTVTNTASANATSPADPNTANNTATATTTVTP